MNPELLDECPNCKKLGHWEAHWTERHPQYGLVIYSIQYQHPDGTICKVGEASGLDEEPEQID